MSPSARADGAVVGRRESDAAVEEWARVDGHYVQEGDLPVVPLAQPGELPVEASTPTPVPTQMANWEVWWTLFFGE